MSGPSPLLHTYVRVLRVLERIVDELHGVVVGGRRPVRPRAGVRRDDVDHLVAKLMLNHKINLSPLNYVAFGLRRRVVRPIATNVTSFLSCNSGFPKVSLSKLRNSTEQLHIKSTHVGSSPRSAAAALESVWTESPEMERPLILKNEDEDIMNNPLVVLLPETAARAAGDQEDEEDGEEAVDDQLERLLQSRVTTRVPCHVSPPACPRGRCSSRPGWGCSPWRSGAARCRSASR